MFAIEGTQVRPKSKHNPWSQVYVLDSWWCGKENGFGSIRLRCTYETEEEAKKAELECYKWMTEITGPDEDGRYSRPRNKRELRIHSI